MVINAWVLHNNEFEITENLKIFYLSIQRTNERILRNVIRILKIYSIITNGAQQWNINGTSKKKKDSVSLQLRPIVFLAEPVYCNKKATI